jgi:hypothetical protein
MWTSVGWVSVSLIIVRFGYMKIKNSKNCPGSVLLFLGDLKNCPGLGFRNSKIGGYEMGARVRYVNNHV